MHFQVYSAQKGTGIQGSNKNPMRDYNDAVPRFSPHPEGPDIQLNPPISLLLSLSLSLSHSPSVRVVITAKRACKFDSNTCGEIAHNNQANVMSAAL